MRFILRRLLHAWTPHSDPTPPLSLPSGTVAPPAFGHDGWFDTGDLGWVLGREMGEGIKEGQGLDYVHSIRQRDGGSQRTP